MKKTFYRQTKWLVLWTTILTCINYSIAFTGGKISLYGIYMKPYGTDAREYSSPGWGGGFEVVVPVPKLSNVLAGSAGLEIVNLMSQSTTFRDRVTGLSVEQQTDQNYFRLYLGVRFGGHGNAFLRPHVGANIALVYYNIRTDVVVPDDYSRENEIRQNLSDKGKAAFGYELSMGLDLNFSNKIAVDGGVKYLNSLSVPQQLGEGSIKIHPKYFQIYLAVGVSFEFLESHIMDNHI
jgi:opacity protein-like surface antigen